VDVSLNYDCGQTIDSLLTSFPAPLEKGGKVEEVVRGIRVRKGLKVCPSVRNNWLTLIDFNLQPEIPPLDTYYDKL
jgi:elongation factor 2